MQRLLALLLLCTVPGITLAQDTSTHRTSGRIAAGPQLVDNNTNSSKLTEYRDLRGNRFPLEFRFNALRPQGVFLDLSGNDVTRRDQSIGLGVGNIGLWRLDLSWDEIPHNLSNRAQSPYAETAPGLLNTSQVIAMPLKRLAPTAAQLPQVLRSDTLIAAFAQSFARPTDLANQTKKGAVAIRYTGVDGLDLSAG